MGKEKCFACDRLTSKPNLVRCIDEQTVFVGKDCYYKIEISGNIGYQPPKGGPRLFVIGYEQLEGADD